MRLCRLMGMELYFFFFPVTLFPFLTPFFGHRSFAGRMSRVCSQPGNTWPEVRGSTSEKINKDERCIFSFSSSLLQSDYRDMDILSMQKRIYIAS